ncbi:MAG: ATP-binding protein [Bryobacteraceae bacterium]|jgi:signal transduction histidine kinase
MDSTRPLRTARRWLSTRTALALGFGVLLILLALSGVNAVQALIKLQSNNEATVKEFLGRAQKLEEIRSTVYLSGTYVRDYLLEPDPVRAEQSRLALLRSRQQIQSMLSGDYTLPRLPDPALSASLRLQIEDYWRALEPVVNWSGDQRRKEGYGFLRDQILPRRSNTLAIADTIASLNRQQLVEQDRQLQEMFAGLRNRLVGALAVMLLFGLMLAVGTAIHILGLEKRTLNHLAEVSEARQELKSLSAKLVDTQESERKNISRELHDAVGQSLSAVQFELHDLALALAPGEGELRGRVDRIRELVEGSLAMVRNVALLLRPSMLDDLGLAAALQWQAHQVTRSTGIHIDVEAEELPDDLPEQHKICIFRLVQEALNNVCRHASANQASIAVKTAGRRLTVVVRDNGRGFSRQRNRGLGLLGIEERVTGLGGSVRIDSEPGTGTTLEAWLPLPQRFGPPDAWPEAEDTAHEASAEFQPWTAGDKTDPHA